MLEEEMRMAEQLRMEQELKALALQKAEEEYAAAARAEEERQMLEE